MGDLVSINDIHQLPVIRQWTTMFDLNTSIHIVGLVIVAVCVEDLPDWWHPLYALLDRASVHEISALVICSSICQTFPATMETLIGYISSAFVEIIVLFISSSWRF